MLKRSLCRVACICVFVLFVSLAGAAVPGILGYHGRVMVDGSPYDGTGYFKFALVNSTGLILWSNDEPPGTNVGPTDAVELVVDEGLFSLGLGDTSLSNMDFEVSPDVFENPEVYLQAWFSSDGETFEQLTPYQRILVVGYAMEAAHANSTDVAFNAWDKTGNAGTVPGTHFLGTTDNQALELHVNSQRAMRLEPYNSSPNIIGGYNGNSVTAEKCGATIGGGGADFLENKVDADFGTIGGGFGNTASGWSATVPGGNYNTAQGFCSFASGLKAKALHDGCFVWGDNTNADIESTGENQFVVRANGGAYIHGDMDVSGTAAVDNLVVSGDLDIEDGMVVKSINNLKDNVTLMAGKNVTIEQTGNTLMISSGGEGTAEIEGIPSGFETITVHIPGLAGGTKPLEMVRIVSDMHQIEKPGLFMMGSPDSDPDSSDYEKPQHRAWIRKDYYIGKYEVTQAQWAAVMEGNPWGLPLTPSHFIGNDHPVEKVSWTDCACFCNRLSELDGRTTVYDESTWSMDNEANGYRLPTEAEWENACRAGTTTRYFWGEDPIYTQIVDYAWFHNNSSAETKEVGLKRLNEWSLYDMSGNVSEWCYDKYSNTYYTYENVVDPVGPNTGSYRVARGGSWNDSAGSCRSAYRLIRLPATRGNSIGFRILLPCP